MTAKERFLKSISYQRPDRPLFSHISWQPYAFNSLLKYLNTDINGYNELIEQDMVSCNPIFTRELKKYDDGRFEDIWGVIYDRLPKGAKFTYEEAVYRPLENIDTIEGIKNFNFPEADLFDYSEILNICKRNKDKVTFIGSPGGLDFMNGIGFMRGQEQVYLDIGLEDEVYLYICKRRFEVTYETFERSLKAGNGQIDIVYVGEDLGTQIAPIISMNKFDRLFAEYYREIFNLAHKYGAKTMMHSCGSIISFIDRLIELGLDILQGVQTDAIGMDIKELHKRFFKKIAFCGTMPVQTVLCAMTPEQVKNEVEIRKELFLEGGLILGPSNVIQGDTPPENFLAMCKALGVMKDVTT